MEIAEYETDRPTVLALGGETAAWVEETLGGEYDVRSVAGVGDADALFDDGAVDCLVVGEDADDGVGAIESLRALDPDVPIVYALAAPSPDDTAAATTAGATAVVARASDHRQQSLPSLLAELVADYDRLRQLRRERDMFHALLSSVPQSTYFKDEEGRHVAASSTTTSVVDSSTLGKTDLDVLGDDIGEEAARETHEDDLAVIESGEPIVQKEERHVLDGEEVLWLRTSKFPWRDDGEVVGLFGQTRDVTAEKEREHGLEHEKRRLEQFASFASHDLRNPLTVAGGNLERALATGEDEPIETAVDALGRIDRLLDDLMTIVTGDVDDADVEWTPLGDVTRRTWEVIEATDATLVVAVPADAELLAVPGGLRQLLENLLSNAVDHGGPTVTVEVGLTDTGFYVADDGPGVPVEEREHVFEHGFTTGGSGVGLALAAEIAESHGWESQVAESDAGGARFEFDRAILRRADRPEPTTGDDVPLSGPVTVGDVSAEGTATQAGEGGWTLAGGGRAVWGGIEEYTAVHGTVAGDCRVEARLADLEAVHEYSKAGVFVADAVEADVALGFVGATAAHGHEAAWRTDPGDPVDTRQIGDGDVLPRWYRIDLVGDRATCYGSADGEGWTVLDQNVFGVGGEVAAGIMVNSHERGTACEAVFEDVRVVGLAADGT